MEHLKKISNKEIYDLDDQDVLKYLIFKDVNDSGRTIVHKESCPFLGTTHGWENTIVKNTGVFLKIQFNALLKKYN